MGKDKLRKFKENETFSCLVQPRTDEVLGCDHRLKGHWKEEMFHNGNPIVLELGCGKGEYTVALAERFPEKNFIGIDIKGARLWKGAKYATVHNMGNVAFLRTRVEFIESLFACNEISEIWITFADPQEKKPKKRLTHPLFLNRYRNILEGNGVVHLKTDSRLLHHFTLETALQNGLSVIEHNEDIYGSGRADELLSIKTFYEANFLAQGIPITYMAFRIDNKKPLFEPEWNQEPYEQQYRTLTRSDSHVASELDKI
ncbi:MAG: tRNA (guanosine(46)-N7)-methyltransferase TrmB [Bacteroidales bacterium]|nr:tRNA (guanosine(46)-N7)-methyltransferase TrmB [Candidatus Cacconaster merdequi]